MAAIQHLGINCIDRDKQEAFYTKHLGFKRARVFNRGLPNEIVVLRLGSACLELFPTKDANAQRSPGEQPIGFKHLAFEVEDIEVKHGDMKAEGLDVGDILDFAHLLPGLRVFFFRDPEGNTIEFMQGWKDEDAISAL